MQKIFDVNNKEDMDLLWSILPDGVYKIEKNDLNHVVIYYKGQEYPNFLTEICVDLHEKTEITRPVNYEDMIGCVGWFWDYGDEERKLSVLKEYLPETGFPFIPVSGSSYSLFEPAKKSELKFYEDK